MDISKVDYWATSGKSVLHRASVQSKLAATACIIACVVITKDPGALAFLLALALVGTHASGLPVARVFLIAMFPSLFALLFAVSYIGSGISLSAAIVLKALTAATSMVLLISTTTYTSLAGSIGRILPRVVADGLFMTYRSFFIMLQLLDNFLDALRLRGGFRPGRMLANAGNVGSGIGMMFIRSYEKSQRLYDVMSVRGYNGKMASPVRFAGFTMDDVPYFAAAFAFLVILAVAAATGGRPQLLAMGAVLAAYAIYMEAARSWKR